MTNRKGFEINVMFGVLAFVVFLVILIIAYLFLLGPFSGKNIEGVTNILQGGLFG